MDNQQMKRHLVKCSSPDCTNKLIAHRGEICFCKRCRNDHGNKALRLQHAYKKPIKDILIETAKRYNTGIGVVDSLEITSPTLWGWLKKYFNTSSFSQFKTLYVCNTDDCCALNISDLRIGQYGFMSQLRKRFVCTCILRGVIMVKVRSLATKERVQEVVMGRKSIQKGRRIYGR